MFDRFGIHTDFLRTDFRGVPNRVEKKLYQIAYERSAALCPSYPQGSTQRF